MMRSERFKDGALLEAYEIAPDGEGGYTVTYFDAANVAIEQRAASPGEVEAIVLFEKRGRKEAAEERVKQVISTARLWAAEAEAHEVTSGNAVETLTRLNFRFGKLLDAFADLLDVLDIEEDN